jgi:hypothetical protein
LFDDVVQADLTRHLSAGGARTPDFVNFWQGDCGGFSNKVAEDEADTEGGGAETPRGQWMVAKVNVDDLYVKLGSIREQQVAEVARMKVPVATPDGSGAISQAPFPVGLVLREPLLAPSCEQLVPTSGGAASRAAVSAAEGAASVLPPPPMPLGFERPQRQQHLAAVAETPVVAAMPEVPVISIGTVGHPKKCSKPCLEESCRKGLACPLCHICGAESRQAARISASAAAPAVAAQPGCCPSVGSMGHPRACAEACKFHSKSKGCKDGALCVRCHICHWNRHGHRKKRPT